MQIKNLLQGTNPYDQKKVDKTEKAKAAEHSERSLTGEADKVSFSEDAKLRSLAVSSANAADGVRAEKVAKLKEQVANGTYKPDTRKIAANLVKQDLDLII